MRLNPKVTKWVGIILILLIGGIHAWDANDSFQDAAYKGWFFLLIYRLY